MSAPEKPVGPRSAPRASRSPQAANSPHGGLIPAGFRISHPKVLAFYGGCFVVLLLLPLVLVSASLLTGNLSDRDVKGLAARLFKRRQPKTISEAQISATAILAAHAHAKAEYQRDCDAAAQPFACDCPAPPVEHHKLEEGSLPSDEMYGRYFDNFLFVAYSDSMFYNSRLRDLLDTWGTLIDKESLIIVGDKEAQVGDHEVRSTKCEAHSHWEGACCKYASALHLVYERMRGDPLLEAAYLTDDDSYVRPQALAQAILQMSRRHEAEQTPAMFGIMGCATTRCHGACAGAGYGINRRGVFATVDPNGTNNVTLHNFVADVMKACSKCDRWADQALSNLAETRKVQLVNYDPPNIYHGWRLSQDGFKNSLVLKDHGPALMYHYVSGSPQLVYLHSLFRPDRDWRRCPVLPAETQAEIEQAGGMCATFQGRTCCAREKDLKHMPWERGR